MIKNKTETLLQDFSLFCHFAYSGSCVTLLITNNARNMSKSTSYTGQPVYSLVIKLQEKPHSTNLSQNTRGQALCKCLIGWKHLMLIDVHKHFDSLRELEICMKAESMNLFHLRLDYVVRSYTLTKANQRRPQEFFVKVYASLLER